MPIDDDDSDLNFRQVDEVIEAYGLDPSLIRAFARDLVAQELTLDFADMALAERCEALSDLTTRFVDMLLFERVDPAEIVSALETAAADLTSERYDARCRLPSLREHSKRKLRFAFFAKRNEEQEKLNVDDSSGSLQANEGEQIRDDPGDGS
jgi:hypothetical protein